jgi:hypothetical protein
MPKRKVDPLGRNHATVQKPQNRSMVDACANYVIENAKKSFEKYPSVAHVYFDACSLIFGSVEALKRLDLAREKRK